MHTTLVSLAFLLQPCRASVSIAMAPQFSSDIQISSFRAWSQTRSFVAQTAVGNFTVMSLWTSARSSMNPRLSCNLETCVDNNPVLRQAWFHRAFVWNLVFGGLNWTKCCFYLDDVIVFGTTFEIALRNLSDVFEAIKSKFKAQA